MRRNQKGHLLTIVLAVLVVVFAFWIFFYVRDHRHTVGHNSTRSQTASSTSGNSAALSSGSSDQDLNSDLQNINGGLAQSSQDLQSSDDALNDQQLPVME